MITIGDLRKLDVSDDTIIALDGVFSDDYARRFSVVTSREEETHTVGFHSETGPRTIQVRTVERTLVCLTKFKD